MRIFFVHHVTWSINSICHFYGSRRFATDDHSTNVCWLSLASLGEAWHHNHHAFPRSAVHGLRRWELDPSGAIIGAMQRVGLAWNVVRITPERQAATAGVALAAADAWRRPRDGASGERRRPSSERQRRHKIPRGDLDPHRRPGELPDQRRARVRRDRVQGAAAQPGARVRARRRDRLLRHRRAGVRRHRAGALGDVRGPHADLAAGQEEAPGGLPVAGRGRAGRGARRGRSSSRPSRCSASSSTSQVAGRALAPRRSRASCARSPTPTPSCCGEPDRGGRACRRRAG